MTEHSANALVRKQEGTVSQSAVPLRAVRAARPVARDIHVPSIGRNDILFALFKHKKLILALTGIGLLAAAAIYVFFPTFYESDAKLLVRYLIERSTVDTPEGQKSGGFAPANDTVIVAEVEILNSWDLAVQTAEAIGPKRLLPNSKNTPSKEAAAGTVSSGLGITTKKGSNIIVLSYTNPNPELATLVLNELVNRYFNRHLEVHRSAGAFDFVTQQTDQVRARLNQTEDALKELRDKAGIVSLKDAMRDLSVEATKMEEQVHAADADIAEQQARLRQYGGLKPSIQITGGDSKPAASPAAQTQNQHRPQSPSSDVATTVDTTDPIKAQASPEILQEYQVLVSGLEKLRRTQLDLLSKYTAESQLVKTNQAQIDENEKKRRSLDEKYPDLPARAGPAGSKSKEFDPLSETAHLAGLQAKRDAMASRLQEINNRIKQVSQVAPQIDDLERQQQTQETNYKYFEATLEKARIDEALDPSKIPNISAVQRPSPPVLVTKTRNKIALGAGVGGLLIGIGFALLKELVLSGTLRRPVEIEKAIGVSPLMTIPLHSTKKAAKSKRNGKGPVDPVKRTSRNNLAPWDAGHFIKPFSEAIRDRLGLYFELHNLTHKPKLVGVAGFSEGAGTSTLAAGLAAALSETNDGKVLLVDVSLGPDQVHPFFKGKPAYPLNAALVANGSIDPAAENLYLATVGSRQTGLAQLGLKKFFDLMPNLKASDFDYIIFDMPRLEQTSPTWGMAPFMDKMLVVVESEVNSREIVKRSYRRLLSERDNVGLVMNKVRAYGPKRLELDF